MPSVLRRIRSTEQSGKGKSGSQATSGRNQEQEEKLQKLAALSKFLDPEIFEALNTTLESTEPIAEENLPPIAEYNDFDEDEVVRTQIAQSDDSDDVEFLGMSQSRSSSFIIKQKRTKSTKSVPHITSVESTPKKPKKLPKPKRKSAKKAPKSRRLSSASSYDQALGDFVTMSARKSPFVISPPVTRSIRGSIHTPHPSPIPIPLMSPLERKELTFTMPDEPNGMMDQTRLAQNGVWSMDVMFGAGNEELCTETETSFADGNAKEFPPHFVAGLAEADLFLSTLFQTPSHPSIYLQGIPTTLPLTPPRQAQKAMSSMLLCREFPSETIPALTQPVMPTNDPPLSILLVHNPRDLVLSSSPHFPLTVLLPSSAPLSTITPLIKSLFGTPHRIQYSLPTSSLGSSHPQTVIDPSQPTGVVIALNSLNVTPRTTRRRGDSTMQREDIKILVSGVRARSGR
ncbi:hypothetical protein BLNAU_12672 [Blattamonas nauphoetae]|uniref:Uncharacterized protein n=1 Tax=Blattamonas nauphoetae TaxID=2049346 RepID=A0ABQ9XMH4_9EUKA|nr:hypothetical protein BLNAU_12672 [Blattamonas nauphoetae]